MTRLTMLVVLIAALLPAILQGAEPDEIVVGAFSAMAPGGPVDGWAPMTFKDIAAHTRYDLVSEAGQTVLQAQSRKAASGLIHPITFSLERYPVLVWRWKVANVLEEGDVRRKSGDDYPARIYITFTQPPKKMSFFQRAKQAAIRALYGQAPPAAALSYIWANHATLGSIHPNPYTDRVQMIAVESGKAHLNQWRTERRNILADYRKAFGAPPPPISGIAVMTDTDNTGGSATAWYGDIRFERQ